MCFYRLEGCNGLSRTYSSLSSIARERLSPSVLWCWNLVGCSVLKIHDTHYIRKAVYHLRSTSAAWQPAYNPYDCRLRTSIGIPYMGIPTYHFHLAKYQLYAQLFVLNYV